MKVLGIVLLSFLSGMVGGALTRSGAPAPVSTPLPMTHIHFGDSSGASMDLTADGLDIKLADGREIELTPRRGLEIQSPLHHIEIATIDAGSIGAQRKGDPDPDGAYVLLDTRLLHSGPPSKEKDLYWSLLATGDITREQLLAAGLITREQIERMNRRRDRPAELGR